MRREGEIHPAVKTSSRLTLYLWMKVFLQKAIVSGTRLGQLTTVFYGEERVALHFRVEEDAMFHNFWSHILRHQGCSEIKVITIL